MTTETPRNTYFALIKYNAPSEGTISVAATSIDHAKEIITKLMEGKKDAEIVDIFDIKDAPKTDQQQLLDIAQHFENEGFAAKKNLN